MSDRALRQLAHVTFGLIVFFYLVDALVPPVASIMAGRGWYWGGGLTATLLIVMTTLFPIAGWLIARRHPHNAVAWVMLAIGMVASIPLPLYFRFSRAVGIDPFPGDAIAGDLNSVLWAPLIGLAGTYLILLFPDGHLPSRRWRPVGWLAGFSIVYIYLGVTLTPGKIEYAGLRVDNPLALSFFGGSALGVGTLLFPLSIILCAAALVVRFRRSTGTERRQLKWLATAAALVAGCYAVAMIGNWLGHGQWDSHDPTWLKVLEDLALYSFALIPVAIAVAILKHGLYEIDVVISRSLVFGALATFITAVYVAIVVGIGHLFDAANRPNLALSIAATAIVAVAFEPVRDRLQRVANRLVYGERATPYEVLSDFADRMGGAYDATQLLPVMARTVGQGVDATQAQVWLRSASGFDLAATWNPEDRVETERPVLSLDDIAGDRVVTVSDHGEVLGAIAVVKPAGNQLTPVEDGLLETLAAQSGPVLRNVRLIEDLRTSRQRLVTTQDEERRRLERNLHDGAQQSLVALALMLRLVQSKVTAQEPRAGASLEQASDELGKAIEELRELARGIYPVVLTERGLGAALSSLAERLPVPVVVDDQLEGRVEADVERALYFIAFETLTSSTRAGAGEAVVQLGHSDEGLALRVSDDGCPPGDPRRGLPLQNLLDRAAVVDARLALGDTPTGLHLACNVGLPDLAPTDETENTGVTAVPLGAGQ